MGCTLYSAENFVITKELTSFVVDDSHPGSYQFKVDRLYDNKITIPYEGDLATHNFDITFDSAQEINIIGLLNHRFASNCTMRFDRKNTAGVWPGNWITIPYRAKDAFYIHPSLLSYKYWRIEITTPATVPKLGEIWLGQITEIPTPFFPFIPANMITHTIFYSYAGTTFSKNKANKYDFVLNYENLIPTKKDAIITFMEKCVEDKENFEPFIFILDKNNISAYAGVFNDIENFEFDQINYLSWQTKLHLIGEGRGYIYG